MAKYLIFARQLLYCCLLIAGLVMPARSLAQTPQIVGPDTVCVGQNSSYTLAPMGPIPYIWTLSGGGTWTANSNPTFNVTWTTPGTHTVINLHGPTFTFNNYSVYVLPTPDLSITSDFEVGCMSIAVDSPRKEGGGLTQDMLDDGACSKVCENSIVRYYATGATGAFAWTVTGANVLFDWGDSIEVQWGLPGTTGLIKLEAVTACGNFEKTICVEVTTKPTALFAVLPNTGPAKDFEACINTQVIFQDLSTGAPQSPLVSWYWNFGDGNTSAQQNPVHTYTTPGNYEISLVVRNACNCTDTFRVRVVVHPTEGPPIVCPSVVCEKQRASYTTPVSCGTYEWEVIGGGIVNGGGPGDNFVEVQWGAPTDGFGYVSLTTPNCSGVCPGATVIKVPVIKLNADIEGPDVICVGKEYEYTLPLWPATRWNWGVIGSPAAVLGIRNDYRVVVKFDIPGTYTIHGTYKNDITLCGGDATRTITVVPASTIVGEQLACQGDSLLFNINPAANADWVLETPAGPLTASGTTYNPTFSQPGTYVLRASGNFCAEPITIIVKELPVAVNALNGEDTVCLNVPYTYVASNNVNGSIYAWSAIGGTVTPANGSDTVTVIWTGGTMELQVWRESIEEPYCAGEVLTMNIVEDLMNPGITGPNPACANGYNVYDANYTSGDSYFWTVSPSAAGSVTGDPYLSAATVLWNNVTAPTAATVTVTVTKCGQSFSNDYNVIVEPSNPPTFIVAPVSACPGFVTFEVTGGAGSYLWDIPGVFNGTGSNNITIEFPYNDGSTSIPYTVSVTASGAGTAACPPSGMVSYIINILPGPRAYASSPGPLNLCPGASANLIGTYTNNAPTPFTFTWLRNGLNFDNPITPNSNTNLAGAYVFVAMAANGCTDTSDAVNISASPCNGTGNGCTTPPNPPTLSFTVDCDAVTLSPSNNTGSFSWQYSRQPSSGAGTNAITFDQPGIYTIKYIEHWPAPYCDGEIAIQVHIGVMPGFYPTITCGANNTYDVTLEDRTAYLLDWTIGSIDWSITPVGAAPPAIPPTGAGNSFTSALEAGESYTVTQTVNGFEADGVTPFTCSMQDLITLPEKPTVRAEVTSTYASTCEQLPIAFEAVANPTSTVISSYLWDFGGQGTSTVPAPQSTFDPGVAGPINYGVSVTITDAYGCIATDDTSVIIHQNLLSGFISDGDTICSAGAPVTLNFVNQGATTPAVYIWHWDENLQNGGIAFGANQSGMYWVELYDANLCRRNTDGEPVLMVQSPVATISGNEDYCDGDAIALTGYIGSSTQYEWRRNGGAVFSTAASITDAGLAPGTYTYQLTVTNTDAISGTVCSDVTTKTVTIHALPSAPTITGPTMLDCATNEMLLTATHGSPGSFTWSNGTSGSDNTIFNGGPYRVWYTNNVGCRSHADVYVPHAPDKYFEYFPVGCYPMCDRQIDDLTLYGPPNVAFNEWNWLRNGLNSLNGSFSEMDPYNVPGTGTYQQRLDNGLCIDTSGRMEITNANCITCPRNIGEVSVTCNDNIPGRYYLNLFLYNTENMNVSYNIGTNLGPVLPSIGNIAPLGVSMLNVEFNSMTLPAPTTVTIQVLYTFENGTKCYFTYEIKLPPCNWQPQRPAPPVGEEDSQARTNFKVSSKLGLYPNPAQQQAVAEYDFGPMPYKERSLVVFDVTGRKVARHQAAAINGKWTINTGEWIPGVYLIRMEADGKQLHTQRLVVNH